MHIVGISLLIFSILCFTVTYAFYKACLPFLPNTLIIFFQSLISWLLILPLIAAKKELSLATHRFGMIALRTIFGLLAIYSISRALNTAGLAEVLLLNNTAPLFIPFLVALTLREKINHRLWPSLIIGFVGVLIIFRPGFGEINAGLIFALLSGVFTASLLIATRQIAHEPFLRVLFYYFLLFWGLLLPFLFQTWELPPWQVWMYLGASALTMIVGQMTFTVASRHVSPQEAAPLIYLSVIFSGLIDWFIWGTTPDFISLVGMIVVCIGGAITLFLRAKKA